MNNGKCEMTKEAVQASRLIEEYKKIAVPMLRLSFPMLTDVQLHEAIDYTLIKRMKNNKAVLNNNYKKKEMNTSLMQMAEYILSREPIITSYGVVFKKHDDSINPLTDMLKTFMDGRGILKKKMFKYPKGSELFNKYNLLQLLAKLDANALYGSMGTPSCIYYNIYVAASTTSQGQSAISTSAITFESFLANNVKFRSINEVIQFIHNVINEKPNRRYKDYMILDHDIDVVTCFQHIMHTTGHGYLPTEKHMEIVWDIVSKLGQEDLNRLFFKNNLFAFMSNSLMRKSMTTLLETLEQPYLDPNDPPEEILPGLEVMWDIVDEFVFYNFGYMDCIDRVKFLPRACTVLMDTDSTCLHLDPWYQFVKEDNFDKPMRIKSVVAKPFEIVKTDEFGDRPPIVPFRIVEPELDYDFYTDEVIELQRTLDPFEVIPQDGFRYSIINILAYILDKVINKAMVRYTKSANSYNDDKRCLMIMKNEFLFKRVLLTSSRRNYASLQELQEGNHVGCMLDVKGLPINKSTLNAKSQQALKKILAEDILNAPEIDQIKVLKKIVLEEKKIINSLRSGEKEYFRPVSIKAMYNYDNPMGIMGIKAAVVWNEVRQNAEAIDLEMRNNLDVVKVKLNKKTIEDLKDVHPDIYDRLAKLLEEKCFKAKGITSIAIPSGLEVPEWLKDFIDYKAIVNDIMKNFNKPMESIGLQMVTGTVNYTNMIRI